MGRNGPTGWTDLPPKNMPLNGAHKMDTNSKCMNQKCLAEDQRTMHRQWEGMGSLSLKATSECVSVLMNPSHSVTKPIPVLLVGQSLSNSYCHLSFLFLKKKK